MTPLDPKDDQLLTSFLKTNNPVAPRGPTDELAQIRKRLRKPWSFNGWIQWSPAFGIAAALLVYLAVPKAGLNVREEEWSIDSDEVQSLIDEEPATEWASLIL